MKIIFTFPTVEKGGAGSGNFAHSGRPGKVGGSAGVSYASESDMIAEFGPLANSIGGYDKSTLALYAGSTYNKIVQAHVRQNAFIGQRIDPRTQSVVDRLDALLHSHKLERDIQVYRATNLPSTNLKAVKQGLQEFTEKGYFSTSLSNDYTDKFAAKYIGNKAYTMQVHIPAGSPGFYMDVISNRGEKEFLLPRNSSFKITGVDYANKMIYVEYVNIAK